MYPYQITVSNNSYFHALHIEKEINCNRKRWGIIPDKTQLDGWLINKDIIDVLSTY